MSASDTRLDHDSELMNNYAVQVPVGGGNAFRTLMDANNRPLIVSIGTDQRLRLIRETEQSTAPWHLTGLAAEAVHSFAVAQNPENGEIRVAYSTYDGAKSKLYYSKPRSLETLASDAPFEWIEHRLDPADVAINRIEMDFEHMMFACVYQNYNAFYCVAGFADDDQPDEKLKLPLFSEEITDFVVGSYGGVQGTYLLYTVGGRQVLQFEAFRSSGVILSLEYAISGRLSSIALIRNDEGEDQLVACGDSVRVYGSLNTSRELIASRGSGFYDVQVTQYDGYTSLWLIEKMDDQHTRLLFLTDRYFDDEQKTFRREPQWTSDLEFQDNIRQFSCVKGSANGNHLILIDAENRLSHHYQDPSSTFWWQKAIAVESLDDSILEFPCYTTRMVLRTGEDDAPAVGEECHVRSSSQVRATINGAVYLLGAEPVRVKTDIMGALTIIHPVDELDTPIFYLGHDKEQPRYVLDPLNHVEERLRAVKSADDFEKARTNEGESLWKGSASKPTRHDLDASATIISRLLDTRRGLLEDERAKLPGAGPAPDRPDGSWGVQFGADGSVTYLDGDQVQGILAEAPGQGFHPFRWIGHTIGSVVHGIKSLFGKAWSFVVRQVDRVTTFILNLAGEIIHVVIDTLEKVFPFLKAIFDAIGLVFKTVLRWLGRFLGWNDIWATHKMIARITRNGTKSLVTHIEHSVSDWKDDLDEYVSRLQRELAEITDKNLPDDSEKKKNRVLSIFNDLLSSPLFSWPLYMLLHGGIVILEEAYHLTIGRVEALDKFVQQQAEIHKEVVTFVEKQLCAILEFATDPNFSTRGLLRLFRPLLDEILKTVGALLRGLLDFLVDAVEKLEELFGSKVQIPFVGPMYKFVTGLLGEKEEFNFLNAFSLMISAPYTIFYKVFSGGHKPFDTVTDGFGEPEMFDAFWKSPPQRAQPAEIAGLGSADDDSSEWDEVVAQYRGVGGVVGCFMAMLNSAITPAKGVKLADEISMVFSIITHANTIPLATAATFDGSKKQAAYGLRVSQYFMSYIPAYVLPNLSRYAAAASRSKEKNIVSMVISVATLGTNIAANVLANPGPLSWTGQMMTRAGSVVSGAGTLADKNPYVLLAGTVLALSGGSCSMANAALIEGENVNHGTFV